MRSRADITGLSSGHRCTAGSIPDAITDRVHKALSALASRDTRTKELGDVRERRRILTEKRAIHASRKTEMTSFFKVDSLAEVAGKLL